MLFFIGEVFCLDWVHTLFTPTIHMCISFFLRSCFQRVVMRVLNGSRWLQEDHDLRVLFLKSFCMVDQFSNRSFFSILLLSASRNGSNRSRSVFFTKVRWSHAFLFQNGHHHIGHSSFFFDVDDEPATMKFTGFPSITFFLKRGLRSSGRPSSLSIIRIRTLPSSALAAAFSHLTASWCESKADTWTIHTPPASQWTFPPITTVQADFPHGANPIFIDSPLRSVTTILLEGSGNHRIYM